MNKQIFFFFGGGVELWRVVVFWGEGWGHLKPLPVIKYIVHSKLSTTFSLKIKYTYNLMRTFDDEFMVHCQS